MQDAAFYQDISKRPPPAVLLTSTTLNPSSRRIPQAAWSGLSSSGRGSLTNRRSADARVHAAQAFLDFFVACRALDHVQRLRCREPPRSRASLVLEGEIAGYFEGGPFCAVPNDLHHAVGKQPVRHRAASRAVKPPDSAARRQGAPAAVVRHRVSRVHVLSCEPSHESIRVLPRT